MENMNDLGISDEMLVGLLELEDSLTYEEKVLLYGEDYEGY